MPGPKDITGSLASWDKVKKEQSSNTPQIPTAAPSNERVLAFDAFTWLVYSMLLTFLAGQLLLLVVFDIF